MSRNVYYRGISVIPVFASGEPCTLATIRAAVELHGVSACLRLRRTAERSAYIPDSIEGPLGSAGLPVQSVDLMIDFGEIASRDVMTQAVNPGRAALAWATAAAVSRPTRPRR